MATNPEKPPGAFSTHRQPRVESDNYESLDAGPSGTPPQQAPIFGNFFQRITEAVGATRELIYDAELRKKAVPFVLHEGGKALHEIQRGLTRNAQALGRQIQQGAAGPFQAYIARLLDRTTTSRRTRAEDDDEFVSLWVGPRPCHEMPHEVRTRFWFVLLENPHVLEYLRPISSESLFTPSPQPQPDPEDPFASLTDTHTDTTTPATAPSQPTTAQPTAPATTTTTNHTPSAPYAIDPLIQFDDDSTSTSQPAATAAATQQPQQPASEAGQPQRTAATAAQATELSGQGTTEGSGTQGGEAGQAGTRPPPQKQTSFSDLASAVSPKPSETGAVVGTGQGAEAGPSGTAPTTAPTTPHAARTASHAEEDDVLSMLDAKQQAQQGGSGGGNGSGGGSGLGSSNTRASFSNLLQKAVDKGKAAAAAVRNAAAPEPAQPPTPPRNAGGAAASLAAGPGKQQGAGGMRSGNMAVYSGDGEWELLDGPKYSSLPTEPKNTPTARMQAEWESCHEEGSPVAEVWSLMLQVPWDSLRDQLAVLPAEDCRYFTLNEMTAGQEEVDDVIMRDIHRTFPEHPFFGDVGGQMSLFRLLKAYSLHDLEVGYCQGMAFAAGVMLMYLPEEPAFRLYCQLMGDEGPNLRRLYLPELEQLKAELARFEQLLSATQPALQAHLESFGIPPVLYVSQWLMTVYTSPFPPTFCAQLIDIMLQDGHDAIMMRLALTIMDELAPALLRLNDFEGLLTYIKITPMEWDNAHLAQVLKRAVKHTWPAPDPSKLAAVSSFRNPIWDQPSNNTDTTTHTATDTAAGSSTQQVGRAASNKEGLSKETEKLFQDVGHIMDAAELELDHEIAQMVRDLRLTAKAPSDSLIDS